MRSSWAIVVAAVVLVAMPPISLGADIRTWNGGGANDLWSNGDNWGGTPPDATGDDLVFSGNTRLTNTNDYVGLLANKLTFAAGAGAFVLNGNPFGVDAISGSAPRSVEQLSSSNITINAHLVQAVRDLTWKGTGTGIVDFAGGVHNASTNDLRISTTGDQFVISGPVTGVEKLTKKGDGMLTISGNNAGFSGGFNIDQGTLFVTNDNAVGSGPLRIKGVLRLADGVSIATTAADLKDNMTFSTPGAASIDATWSTTGGQRRAINVAEGTITTTGPWSGNARKKTGPGTWVFASTTGHNKGYNVEEGTFLIEGEFTHGAKEHEVFSGATIGGSGGTAKDIIIQSGGNLAPGSSIGTLNINNAGNLTLGDGANLSYEAAAISDLVQMADGTLTFDGDLNILVADFDGSFVSGTDLTLIAGFGNSPAFGGTANVTLPDGWTHDEFVVDDLSTRLTNVVTGSADIIPEPATLSLLALGGLGLLARRKRKR